MNRITGYILRLYFRFPGLRLFLFMIVIFLLFSIISTALMVSDQVSTDPVGWDRMRYLSPAGLRTRNVHVDKKGNLIAAVFEGVKGGKTGIYPSLSFDGGTTFNTAPPIVEFTSDIGSSPRVAISSNGEICVTWYLLTEDESGSIIYFSRSGDMGATWSAPEKLSFGMNMEIMPEPVFDDRNRLHIFFVSYSDNSFSLFHAVMNDEKKFGKAESMVNIKGTLKGAFFPAVRFQRNNAVVICQGKDENYTDHLYYTISDDYGASWSKVDRITTGRSNNQAPAIEIYDDTIYLVFMNNSEKNWGIYLLKGYRLGSRWDDTPLKISTTNANCYTPDVSMSPENELFILWHDLREKSGRIFYRKYSVKNRELLQENKLSMKRVPSRNAVCLNTSRNIIALWEEGDRVAVNYTDNYVSSPAVYSRSHPEGKWSRENSAVVYWNAPRDESGIAGYAVISDKNPYTNPTIQNRRSDSTSMLLAGLDDGITYFHIRAIDGAGNMSRTVHYKIQVSSNPLSMPVIVSPTHPENKKSDNPDAIFRWAVNDSRRLKGFVYSISRDKALIPDKYLKDFEISFKGLEEGVYFFNLAAVSATNQVSRVATYPFIVGEGKIDTDYLRRLANREYDIDTGEKKIVSLPTIEISLPFGTGVSSTGDFTAILKPLNIAAGRISGYSVVIDSTRRVPPERVNLMNNILRVEGLNRGEYTIGVKCRYYTMVRGVKKYHWTEPVYSSFKILPETLFTPFDQIYAVVMKKIGDSPLPFSVVVLLFSLTVAYRGYGNRISFYFKSLNYRIRYIWGRS